MRRRVTLGLLVATSVALMGCTSIPEGAKDAEALECPPGEEGCDVIRPVGPGGELEMESGEFWLRVADGAPVTGEIELTINNLGPNQLHNVEVLGAAEGSAIPEALPDETDTQTVLLFPGEWTVICNIPGHRASGMETTITVYATEEEAQAAIEAGETDADRDAAEDPADT